MGKWTRESLIESAKRHRTRREFHSSKECMAARRLGIYAEVSALYPRDARTVWTRENIPPALDQYESKTDVMLMAGGLRDAAKRLGIWYSYWDARK